MSSFTTFRKSALVSTAKRTKKKKNTFISNILGGEGKKSPLFGCLINMDPDHFNLFFLNKICSCFLLKPVQKTHFTHIKCFCIWFVCKIVLKPDVLETLKIGHVHFSRRNTRHTLVSICTGYFIHAVLCL